MSRILVLQVVVECWTCGYKLSEEVLLEGIFIGNFVHGGIRDVSAYMCSKSNAVFCCINS